MCEPISPAPPMTTSFLPLMSTEISISRCATSFTRRRPQFAVPPLGRRANKILAKAFAVMAHPADAARGNPGHQGEIRHVLRHDRSGRDKSVTADGVAADDGRVRTDGGAALDQSGAELALARNRRARIDDIGEHATRATEDVILQRHAFIETDVVLNLAVVADRTRGPITTFCPIEQLRPIETSPRIWQKCQMLVPSPICTGSSTYELS